MPGFHGGKVLPGHSPDYATVGEYRPVRQERMHRFSGLPILSAGIVRHPPCFGKTTSSGRR
jgi:hypothetical protein